AMVSLEARRASVRLTASEKSNTNEIITAITAAGYKATPIKTDSPEGATEQKRDWHLNLWVGGIVTATLMLGEWVLHFGMTGWFAWVSFALAGMVQVFCGAQFYQGAWRQVKVGSSNMDTLVALGSTTAFGYSVWALLSGRGGHLYFMEAAAIITLISVGHWVEARVSARASDALKALMQLAPATARRLQTQAPASSAKFNPRDILNFKPAAPAQTTEVEVAVADLKIGDLIVLRPGDHVPVDGEVAEGNSAVNEAMLTGESLPAEKASGAKVFAGTANLNGRLVVRVTATGEATALAQVIAAVQRAQTSRANIQRLGDRVSNVFVPVVTIIALLAGLAWAFAPETMANVFHMFAPYLWTAHPPSGAGAGFIIAAAVLIVACPCAMGLATPAAIMASANAAARHGILIRDGVALEKAGNITAIVFDKTGTLTVGNPEVVAVSEVGGQKSEVGNLAAALARDSTHPISQAVARLAVERVELQEWQEIRGAGVEAKQRMEDGGWSMTRLGSIRWLRESGVALAAGESFIAEWSGQGATIVGLVQQNDLIGLFAVKDTLKPGAAAVVTQLQQQGLKAFLLTGDNVVTAAGIAKQCGIASENVFAEVRPEQKAELIKKLQARGERVAFVGDGINDAPALEQADLGIAVTRASDVARAAADIVLLKSDIEAVPEALGLARATLRTIKQNLFWAFFYNAVGVPLAALGFMSPVLCALAMGVSDLVVIGNALKLKWHITNRSSATR
ncbi:MAG: heavy metal translocating P-type ATPase, partial [Verrucomicrobiota bacterium]